MGRKEAVPSFQVHAMSLALLLDLVPVNEGVVRQRG